MSYSSVPELLPPEYEDHEEKMAAELARRNLADFVRAAWHVLEQRDPYQHNWHLDAVYNFLESITAGEYAGRTCWLNEPPGSMKSLAVCVMWPAWHWINTPAERFSFSSFSETFAYRDSGKFLQLISSDWYQKYYGDKYKIRIASVSRVTNDRTGEREATSVRGMTGKRAGIIVIDEPHNLDEIYSDTIREEDNNAIKGTWWGRLNDPRTGTRLICGQRAHMRDAFSVLAEVEECVVLSIPERYSRRYFIPGMVRYNDPRKTDGELMWPERRNEAYVKTWEFSLGKAGTAAQLQQQPSMVSGGTLRRDAWRRYRVPPAQFDQVAIFGDLTFEGEETAKAPAYNSVQVWGLSGGEKYWLDVFYEKCEFTELVEGFISLCKRWPQARAKVFEDKANAAALKSYCRKTIPGIILFPKDITDCPEHVKSLMGRQDKMARLSYVSAEQEAGNIYIPENSTEFPCRFGKEVEDFVEQASTFKTSRYKDLVDTFSIMVLYFSIRGGGTMNPDSYKSVGSRSHNMKKIQGAY